MTDTSQQVPLQQESPQTSPLPDSSSSQPKKMNRKVWIIIGIVIGILCLCSIACVAVFATGMFNVNKEKAPVESVLDAYMTNMANNDAESAYALFSPRARKQISISDVQEMLDENNYILFEGYQSLSVSAFQAGSTINVNPDIPQGTVAKVAGIINYENGIQGNFNGTLEKVDDEWMMVSMFVTVPPSKMK